MSPFFSDNSSGTVPQGPGSHEIWWNPKNRRFATIPRPHGAGDIPKGTLAAHPA
ncbi:MAG: type II toxin-antitoxin system HicA family toxin [Chloroflexota bacterium]